MPNESERVRGGTGVCDIHHGNVNWGNAQDSLRLAHSDLPPLPMEGGDKGMGAVAWQVVQQTESQDGREARAAGTWRKGKEGEVSRRMQRVVLEGKGEGEGGGGRVAGVLRVSMGA